MILCNSERLVHRVESMLYAAVLERRVFHFELAEGFEEFFVETVQSVLCTSALEVVNVCRQNADKLLGAVPFTVKAIVDFKRAESYFCGAVV